MAGTEITVAGSERDAWSIWDRKLVQTAAARHGRVSPEELSKICGGSPAACAKRLRELLAARDWLSIIETRALITEDMLRLKEHLFNMMEGGEWYDDRGRAYGSGDARWASELNKTLKEMSRQAELAVSQIDTARAKVRNSHADLMVSAIDQAFKLMMEAIAEEHPDIDVEDYRSRMMADFLPRAVAHIEEARNPDEARAGSEAAA